MTLKTKFLTTVGPMTPFERARGRYMRAPDHPGGDGGSGGSSDAGDAGGGADEGGDPNSQDLGGDDTDTEDSGDGSDDGVEDEGSDNGDAGDDGDDNGDDDGDADGDDDADGEDGDASDDNQRDGKPPKVDAALVTAANARADAAQAEADKWRRIAEGAPSMPEPVGEGEDDPNSEPNPEDFEFGVADPEYIAAKAEWSALNRLRREGQEARIKAELQQMEANYQKSIPAALAKYADYDEVVTQGSTVEATDPKFWPCPPLVAIGIRSSPVGYDVAYHLATNKDEAKRIANLHDVDQAREFGRIEGRYLYEAEQAAKKDGKQPGGQQRQQTQQPPRKPTAAPKPPKRQTRGSGGQFKTPADTNDFKAFEKTYNPALRKQG